MGVGWWYGEEEEKYRIIFYKNFILFLFWLRDTCHQGDSICIDLPRGLGKGLLETTGRQRASLVSARK